MKPTNFKQAAQASLDERWYKMAKAESIEEMNQISFDSECALCQLQRSRGHNIPFKCGKCPLNDFPMPHKFNGSCCKEWRAWERIRNPFESNNFPYARKQATSIVKRLEKVAKGE